MSKLDNYASEVFFDEIIDHSNSARFGNEPIADFIKNTNISDLSRLKSIAEASMIDMGITFNVYSESEGTERIIPVDIIPRTINQTDWKMLEKGLKQRILTLNMFLDDIYNDQKILKDKIIPREVIEESKGFLKQCMGIQPRGNIFIHITGTDLIRDSEGNFKVLEDNLRSPSGVSYMLTNREISKRIFPSLLKSSGVRSIGEYPAKLFDSLSYSSYVNNPNIVLLTPGVFNSAYFEHSYLSQQMGIELVENSDLVVDDNFVKMRTTKGFERVDCIYRRVDDTFLDPLHFNKNSLLGVPGLFDVYRKGNVTIANAFGTGVADDKVVYAYVPKMIKYYLNENPIIDNVETFLCREPEARKYVLENIEKLVVKEANEAGGYGMLIGPKSTKEEQDLFRQKIKDDPNNYIAQPTISLSTSPCITNDTISPRHVDLRPYVIYGKDVYVTPGGLTRVALKEGSLVVNSSQGGGSKDTWVFNK
jgi:uncharacterized circularly permuted ATP-grasp superfamily protein